MNWYYTIEPSHTRVRVFMNGGLCGFLTFRNEEFEELMNDQNTLLDYAFGPNRQDPERTAFQINFINETPGSAS